MTNCPICFDEDVALITPHADPDGELHPACLDCLLRTMVASNRAFCPTCQAPLELERHHIPAIRARITENHRRATTERVQAAGERVMAQRAVVTAEATLNAIADLENAFANNHNPNRLLRKTFRRLTGQPYPHPPNHHAMAAQTLADRRDLLNEAIPGLGQRVLDARATEASAITLEERWVAFSNPASWPLEPVARTGIRIIAPIALNVIRYATLPLWVAALRWQIRAVYGESDTTAGLYALTNALTTLAFSLAQDLILQFEGPTGGKLLTAAFTFPVGVLMLEHILISRQVPPLFPSVLQNAHFAALHILVLPLSTAAFTIIAAVPPSIATPRSLLSSRGRVLLATGIVLATSVYEIALSNSTRRIVDAANQQGFPSFFPLPSIAVPTLTLAHLLATALPNNDPAVRRVLPSPPPISGRIAAIGRRITAQLTASLQSIPTGLDCLRAITNWSRLPRLYRS